ncbi:MAG: hypothetical protein H7Y42_11630 [Chitinophagaceae bacterium]|nr:hypothetical protein [Chitinophagaceae bacterium]
MTDDFDIPVTWKGESLLFPARLLQYGYSYKIEVELQGEKYLFEPDEDRNWRALVPFEEAHKARNIQPALLEAVAHSLGEILK